MLMRDLHALPSGAIIQVDAPNQDVVRGLHRLGFHSQEITPRGHTLIKQTAPNYALRGLDEPHAAFQDDCRRLLAHGSVARCQRLS